MRLLDMSYDKGHVAVLVRALIAKHGHMASRVAADRVRLWKMAGDPVTANLWVTVADEAATTTIVSNSGLRHRH